MRPLFSILATAALLWSFAEAPFAHTHEQSLGQAHHSFEQAHAHSPKVLANTAGARFEDNDPADDERPSNWFQTVQHVGIVVYVAPQQVGIVSPLVRHERLRMAPASCSHDPPYITNLPPRAPPAVPA